MVEFDTLLLRFTIFLPPIGLTHSCDWSNGAGDVNVDVEDTYKGCGDADSDTAAGIEGVWAEGKLIGVCDAETWYDASLCNLDAILVCSNSPPRTMPVRLLTYSEIKKKGNKNCKKRICYRVFQNCAMIATTLSNQNKELTS